MSEGHRSWAASDCGGRTLCSYPQQVNLKLRCHQIPKEASAQLPWETGWPHRGPLRIKEDWAPFSTQNKWVTSTEAPAPKNRAPDFPLICLWTHRTSEEPASWPQWHVPPSLTKPHSTFWLRSLSEPGRANISFPTKASQLRHCFAWKECHKSGKIPSLW